MTFGANLLKTAVAIGVSDVAIANVYYLWSEAILAGTEGRSAILDNARNDD